MRTRPRPSSLILLSSRSGWVTHFGFEIGHGFKKLLCHSKTPAQHNIKVISPEAKKPTCVNCEERYKKLQKKISELGVEWVCDGKWLPMEERTFKDTPYFLARGNKNAE